jgi:hypothetical protein
LTEKTTTDRSVSPGKSPIGATPIWASHGMDRNHTFDKTKEKDR